MLISDVLKGKSSSGIVMVHPDILIGELAQVLAENRIGAAVVSEDGARLVGIVSERDVVRAVANGAEALGEPVRQLMTSDVITVGRGEKLEDVAETMTNNRIRHLPVIEDGVLVGLVSIGDIVKSRIQQLHAEREHLASYISG